MLTPTSQAVLMSIQFSMIIFTLFWAQYSAQREEIDHDIKRLQRRRHILLHRMIQRRSLGKKRPGRPRGRESNISRADAETAIRNAFHISRKTFAYLCEKLGPALPQREISLDKRIAIALSLLRGVRSSSLVEMYGVEEAAMSGILKDFCKTVIDVLYTEWVCFPTDDIDDIAERFEEVHQFPNCVGVIDAVHVPVMAPEDNPNDYVNQRGWHSIMLLSVIDTDRRFRFVNVGMPGCLSNTDALQTTDLYHRSLDSNLMPPQMHLLGDETFFLMPWIMVPYSGVVGLSEIQENFNQRLGSTRKIVDETFRRLSGRWDVFGNGSNPKSISETVRIIKTCCIIHNICEKHGDVFPMEWDKGLNVFRNSCFQPEASASMSREWKYRSWEKRDALAHDLLL